MKASKVKVHDPPEGVEPDARFYVYVYDVFNKEFLEGSQSFDTIEKATAFQRHEQERIYQEQEAEPELFDLPFVSSDPKLLEHVKTDEAYRDRLKKALTHESRARKKRR